MKQMMFGSMNGHAVGVIMKEMVRRATEVINAQRFTFEAQDKEGYSGKLDDIVTSADKAAQETYLRVIRGCFPGFGILAEEDGLRTPCTDPELGDAYITVDPLDGTKAFNRRQSHGVGTMVAIVQNGVVQAAYVGDVLSQEIYGFRPGSDKVHRINKTGYVEQLPKKRTGKLREQYALLRHRPSQYSRVVQALLHTSEAKKAPGVCKDIEITGGSIGISMARLWKGEVAMAVIRAGNETPWDTTPVIGISQKLGYVFLKPVKGRLVEEEPRLFKEVTKVKGERVIVHRSHLPELMEWQEDSLGHDA